MLNDVACASILWGVPHDTVKQVVAKMEDPNQRLTFMRDVFHCCFETGGNSLEVYSLLVRGKGLPVRSSNGRRTIWIKVNKVNVEDWCSNWKVWRDGMMYDE